MSIPFAFAIALVLLCPSAPGSVIGTNFCEPGQAPTITCPCGNNPTGPGRGCDNTASTGGGILTITSVSGTATIGASDDVVLTATNLRPNSSLCFFLQGELSLAGGTFNGDGVLCLVGTIPMPILRLNGRTGNPSDALGTVVYPNTTFPLSVSGRSLQLGHPISTGQKRYYQTWYRDPDMTFCPDPPGNEWNVTQAVELTWI